MIFLVFSIFATFWNYHVRSKQYFRWVGKVIGVYINTIKWMLCIFPKVFTLKRQLPRGIFLSGNWAMSQAATSQVYPSRSARPPLYPILKLQHLALIAAGGASEGLTESLRSCLLENCTFGKMCLRKLSLEKSPLGKCLWENTHKDEFSFNVWFLISFFFNFKFTIN